MRRALRFGVALIAVLVVAWLVYRWMQFRPPDQNSPEVAALVRAVERELEGVEEGEGGLACNVLVLGTEPGNDGTTVAYTTRSCVWSLPPPDTTCGGESVVPAVYVMSGSVGEPQVANVKHSGEGEGFDESVRLLFPDRIADAILAHRSSVDPGFSGLSREVRCSPAIV